MPLKRKSYTSTVRTKTFAHTKRDSSTYVRENGSCGVRAAMGKEAAPHTSIRVGTGRGRNKWGVANTYRRAAKVLW